MPHQLQPWYRQRQHQPQCSQDWQHAAPEEDQAEQPGGGQDPLQVSLPVQCHRDRAVRCHQGVAENQSSQEDGGKREEIVVINLKLVQLCSQVFSFSFFSS